MDDIENLLNLVKFEAYQVTPSDAVPHGIRYSLALHDKHNRRVIGYHNAHSFKSSKKYGAKKSSYDHIHKQVDIVPYEFETTFRRFLEECRVLYGEQHMNTLKVGIISKENYKKRTIDIAKGIYKPKADEPKVWFESIKSMAQILSNENQELLRIIVEHKPLSLTELVTLTGRAKPNLSRTLKTLERYGIVELHREKRNIIPEVKATNFSVEFGLDVA